MEKTMKVNHLDHIQDNFLTFEKFEGICARTESVNVSGWSMDGDWLICGQEKVCLIENPKYISFLLNAAKDLKDLIAHVRLAEQESDKMETLNKALQSKIIKLQSENER